MDAQPFLFPHRHLPILGTEDWSERPAPLLLFKQQGTDKGLANATRFFWLAKRVRLVVSMSVDDVAWVESEPTTSPPTYVSSTHTFSYEKDYSQYDTDPDVGELADYSPPPNADQSTWVLPHERAAPLDEFAASGFFQMLSMNLLFEYGTDPDITYGGIHVGLIRVEFNAALDRWCLALDGSCAISGSQTSGDYWFTCNTVALLTDSDYVLEEGEVTGSFIIPDIFESSPKPMLYYVRPFRYAPGSEDEVYPAHSVSFELIVDYWNIP